MQAAETAPVHDRVSGGCRCVPVRINVIGE